MFDKNGNPITRGFYIDSLGKVLYIENPINLSRIAWEVHTLNGLDIYDRDSFMKNPVEPIDLTAISKLPENQRKFIENKLEELTTQQPKIPSGFLF